MQLICTFLFRDQEICDLKKMYESESEDSVLEVRLLYCIVNTLFLEQWISAASLRTGTDL